MALSSTSTRTDVENQIKNNLDYDVTGSTSKCKLLIEALRHWLIFFAPTRVQHGGASRGGGEELEQDTGRFERLLAKAEAWLTANDPDTSLGPGGGGVTYLDFAEFQR